MHRPPALPLLAALFFAGAACVVHAQPIGERNVPARSERPPVPAGIGDAAPRVAALRIEVSALTAAVSALTARAAGLQSRQPFAPNMSATALDIDRYRKNVASWRAALTKLSNDLADKRRKLGAKQAELHAAANGVAVGSPLQVSETGQKARLAERDLRATQRDIDAALSETR